MKKILFLFALVTVLFSCGTSKSVSYTHKPLAAEGCSVSYSVMMNDGQLKIVVTVKSDRLVFSSEPTMMLKNFNGEVLTLKGVDLQSRSETGGLVISNVFIPVTEVRALAEFPVDEKDINFFATGVSKVRLSTVPIVHEREFSKDVIGGYLYSSLSKAISSEDSF